MAKHHNIDGIKVDIIDEGFGKGGQGRIKKVLHRQTQIPLVAKILPQSSEALRRTQALIDLKLWERSLYLAAPFVADCKKGNIRHLAVLADGEGLLSASERPFHEHLAMAFQLSCLWTILEEQRIAHGDIAPSNIQITPQGEAYLIDFDSIIINGNIPATTKGQHMMLAPEVRDGSCDPSIETDRFAWAVLFNILLLRRHPADGLTQTPADMDRVMSQGRWPEHDRDRDASADELPTAILGGKLTALFDRAFLLDPSLRPSADEWCRTLHGALEQLLIHDCAKGFEGAFVPKPNATHCPYCHQPIGHIEGQLPDSLKIRLIETGKKFSVPLRQAREIILGRSNLRSTHAMSRRQLSIVPHGPKLLLRHLGQNPSVITMADGKPYRFETIWVNVPVAGSAPIKLNLAGSKLEIRA